MFTSLDVKDLATRIKEKEEELEKPIANGEDFVPLLKHMIMFHDKYYKEKEVEIGGLKYRILTRTHYGYCEELGEEPTKMVDTTFEVIRVREEKIYKEQTKHEKWLKRPLAVDKIEEHTSTIMYITAKVNNKSYFENLDDIKIKKIEIHSVNVEEFDILYAVNDYLRGRIKEYFEKRLNDLEERVALKQLSPLPNVIKFEG